MNIIFFTQDDPFYVKVFFDEFLNRFKSLEEIKAIVISKPLGKATTLKLARQMFDFYGPVDFIRMGLKFARIKLLGKRKLKKVSHNRTIPKTYSLRQVAEVYGINVIERSDLNNQSFHDSIKQYDPDLFISVASPVIFEEDLINIPNLDCINVHNAPLPKYRGMLPNFWQLYHGEKQAGITIHRINAGIDTGDIITQYYLPIEHDDSLNDLIIKTKKEDAKLIIKVIEDFRNGKIEYHGMVGEGSYNSFPTSRHVVAFKKKGKRLL
jgi:methionyl-tRNA formyltransferase